MMLATHRESKLGRERAVIHAVEQATESGRLPVDKIEVIAGAVDVAQAHECRQLVGDAAVLLLEFRWNSEGYPSRCRLTQNPVGSNTIPVD